MTESPPKGGPGKPGKVERVKMILTPITRDGDFSPDGIPSLEAKCTKCGHELEVYGQHENSIRRAAVTMRKECPRKEQNFYGWDAPASEAPAGPEPPPWEPPATEVRPRTPYLFFPLLRIFDNEKGDIVVRLDGRELHSWAYAGEHDRRSKMLAAHAFIEGWEDGYIKGGAAAPKGESK